MFFGNKIVTAIIVIVTITFNQFSIPKYSYQIILVKYSAKFVSVFHSDKVDSNSSRFKCERS